MITRAVSLFAVASFVVACGGSTTSPGGGGGGSGSGSGGSGSGGSGSGGSSSGGSSSGGSSSGGGPGAGPCLTSAPGPNAACGASLEGTTCEYGSDPDPNCNSLFTCTHGTWINTSSQGSAQTCPTPAATGDCPSSYAAAQSAGACTSKGLACGYTDGRCDCAQQTGGPPSVGGGNLHWLCDDPPAGCPTPRPHLGLACNVADQDCNYGACTIPDGINLSCTGGIWISSPTACALAY